MNLSKVWQWYAIFSSDFLFQIIITLVLLNSVVLALEHYKQPIWLEEFQESANLFFVILFTLEMFLKMYSLGLQVRCGFNN